MTADGADAAPHGRDGPHRRGAVLPIVLWGAALALGVFVRPGTPEPTFLQTLLLPAWGGLVAAALWGTWRAVRPRGRADRRGSERRRGVRRDPG